MMSDLGAAFALFLVILLLSLCACAPVPKEQPPARPIFHTLRMFKDKAGDHWYVVRADEMDNLLRYTIKMEKLAGVKR